MNARGSWRPAVESEVVDGEKGKTARLTGSVRTPVEKSLTGNIAKQVSGIEQVDTPLTVNSEQVTGAANRSEQQKPKR